MLQILPDFSRPVKIEGRFYFTYSWPMSIHLTLLNYPNRSEGIRLVQDELSKLTFLTLSACFAFFCFASRAFAISICFAINTGSMIVIPLSFSNLSRIGRFAVVTPIMPTDLKSEGVGFVDLPERKSVIFCSEIF